MTMIKTGAKAALVLGALLLASAGAATAQTDAIAGTEGGAAAATVAFDTATSAAQLARADELMSAGQLAEARSLLVSLAYEQKMAGQSAAETYLKLAVVEHGEGSPARAAAALDDAASEAEVHRQPALQARALLDATSVYTGIRQHAKAQARLSRLAAVPTDDLPADLQAEIRARTRR